MRTEVRDQKQLCLEADNRALTYKVSEVADRLGVTVKSLHDWIKKYGSHSEQHQALSDQQAEIRKLKAELRRVTEERDILKEAAAYFAEESKKSTRS